MSQQPRRPRTVAIEREEEMQLLRLQRVAFITDSSIRQVHQWCAEGRLKKVKIGPRSARITRDSLDRFIAEARDKARAR